MKENSIITGFHAHVYYDSDTREVAAKIREGLGAKFEVVLGRWHDQPVGPHPKSMYQVAFAPHEFPQVVPWLMLNREGLDILVHPETGDDVTDHTAHALWLGKKLELNIKFLQGIS
ncbi:DOPA 4,5-dioxygenase family protein [Nostoc parmelioides]|uniref:4,5-dioxygenase n=1 Tax=Nostoc parmelioides FACHB-3921 TaxID=2692909 RepID=A0ABR8B822_9NOSO|nr:DOPA 4,5-dioxygenase family protein [Nostoc parmelioides]MBD2250008.1 4,5-dioxygenase [Nostoc parmelioides FACHB-3921]